MPATRIYHAINSSTQEEQLVRASSATQAVRAVSERGWTAQVASQDDLVRLAANGTPVLDPTKVEE